TRHVHPQPQRRTDAGARLAGSRVRRRCPCPTLPADAAGQAADRESGPGLGGCPAPGQRAAGGRGDSPPRQSRQEIEDAAGEVLATFFLGDIVVYANERRSTTLADPPVSKEASCHTHSAPGLPTASGASQFPSWSPGSCSPSAAPCSASSTAN